MLVANHFVEKAKALELSIAFNRARIEYAKTQLPKDITMCALVYDIRGPKVAAGAIEQLRSAFSDISELRVSRNGTSIHCSMPEQQRNICYPWQASRVYRFISGV
ncbi:hypothetical protein [Undibacterium curvum]|uniref:Uncharacterized protein n=1 Tax=Undibacterium curvum TaxID=2762294 RepID=A0ABR7A0G5_9BURK|nr:hypothetical protein [Undibacterium curvum]MBC3930404.1 hypothetical protein [Undibacterium curvum]